MFKEYNQEVKTIDKEMGAKQNRNVFKAQIRRAATVARGKNKSSKNKGQTPRWNQNTTKNMIFIIFNKI